MPTPERKRPRIRPAATLLAHINATQEKGAPRAPFLSAGHAGGRCHLQLKLAADSMLPLPL